MTGIFDSGSGGLSVFREIYRLLPDEEYLFFSDNANCPYGNKPVSFIQNRCQTITDFLLDKGADIIVVACNTATAAAINVLRERYKIKFIAMEPAVKPAAMSSVTGVIGIMATAGTLHGSKYLTTKGRFEKDVMIVESVGEGWVELVENGLIEGPEVEKAVSASLQPLLKAGADSIVLGCTHYPFLAESIKKIAGPGMRVIDPAPAVARHLIYVMVQEGLIEEKTATKVLAKTIEMTEAENNEEDVQKIWPDTKPNIGLYTSGNPEALKRIFKTIFPDSTNSVNVINI